MLVNACMLKQCTCTGANFFRLRAAVKPQHFSTSRGWFEQSEQFGPWTDYERADSPDNFPGGKYGLTPARGPALNPDRSPYVFAYPSQADYLAAKQSEVLALGGQVTDVRYRLPAQKPKVSKRTYTPDLAIAYSAPVRESTVTSSWATTQPRFFGVEQRNPSLFVRS